MRAIALVSGGLDSIVAAWAARKERLVAAALTCDYGQRAREREVAAARAVAARLGCSHIVVELPWLGRLGHSALTDPDAPVPSVDAAHLDDPERAARAAAAVWVPNRNGVLVNVAAAYAEALDCGTVICGFNAEEAATFPDNSPAFVQAADRFLELSTRRRPRLMSPTAGLTKAQIVTLGKRTGAPLEHVWSCYHGGARQCGACESCRRLKRALRAAGMWDDKWARRFALADD